MNIRVGKSFGLALIAAVGILALMLALGVFNPQKAGAQQVADDDTVVNIDSEDPSDPVQIKPANPAPGAAVQVELTVDFDGAVDDFGVLEIELKGFGIPSDIDRTDVLLRNTGGTPSNGLPTNVDVENGVIQLELDDTGGAEAGNAAIGTGDTDDVIIVLRKGAGITAPALAGKYDVFIDGYEANELVTVSATLSLDPTMGNSGTEVTVTGKAFADGTASLSTHGVIDPDQNEDGIQDVILIGDEDDDASTPAVIPGTSDTNDYTIDVDGDGVADFDILQNEDTDGYVAVNVDDTALGTDNANVQVLGYDIVGNPTATTPEAPTIAAATIVKGVLKDVAVNDGAFETTVMAEDLEMGIANKSVLTLSDAAGTDVVTVFQVTGTMALGADSVGKGGLLKISLSDWIDDYPDEVKIGGVTVADTVDSDDAGTTGVNEDETLFRDMNGEGIDAPTATTTPDADGAVSFYVKVIGDVRTGTKTVVLLNDDTTLSTANVEITALGLTVSPGTAVVGQVVTVGGTGFGTADGNQLSTLTVGGTPQTELSNRNDVNDYNVLSNGRILISFAVPEGVTKGDNVIRIEDDADLVGEVTLTVPEPMISLEPTSSRRGTTVTVSGTGFPAADTIDVNYGDETRITTGRTDSNGNFTASFGIPSDAAIGGEKTVEATVTAGEVDYAAEATHTVPDKQITVTPDELRSGDTAVIVGTGFPRYSDVQVALNDGELRQTNARTNDIGDFSLSYVIPGIDPGTHVINVDAGGETDTAVINVPAGPGTQTSRAASEVFAAEAASGNLVAAWRFDNDSGLWSFYDPTLDEADNSYGMAAAGDIVWLNLKAATTFQGASLNGGWQLVTLQ